MIPDLIPRAIVAEAISRLEDGHCYGFPEFWEYVEEQIQLLEESGK